MVSIHAPTRGATIFTERYRAREWFQSTRPRGARPRRRNKCHRNRSFNPRAHAGRDPDRGSCLYYKPFQSTRPRGARPLHLSTLSASPCFNPRAHAGRDDLATVMSDAQEFQSTRPRGARRKTRGMRGHEKVSIHAPTRGATISRCMIDSGWGFNPRAHAGRDSRCCKRLPRQSCFNPRAHAGRDSERRPTPRESRRFNPRAHAGRDEANPDAWHVSPVSIHAPTRGATSGCGAFWYSAQFQSTRPRGARQRAAGILA